jgi:RNA-splicing ligase RtcB
MAAILTIIRALIPMPTAMAGRAFTVAGAAAGDAGGVAAAMVATVIEVDMDAAALAEDAAASEDAVAVASAVVAAAAALRHAAVVAAADAAAVAADDGNCLAPMSMTPSVPQRTEGVFHWAKAIRRSAESAR